MDKAADGLLALMPLYHRHIFRINRHISGMETAEYRVLGVLMKSGPQPISEIGRALYISKPYMTVLIDSLMEKGWIEKRHDPDDRRVILVSITPDGKKHLHRAFEVCREDVKTLLSGLGKKDISQLCSSVELLKKILEKLP
ncbi:MAG: transcriptional repressor MprA [Methanoregula sp. PtaU1.Bin006]|nr:MAG: transcriptional repressor MprA [Methanoregula sp. PtaB.Bin085]OPY34310.1 MAG: transcriptional repressor MprA [Methanoregula sp. PtaU1.Bin006]